MTCPHPNGQITELSAHTYRPGSWITRPCDCQCRDPPDPYSPPTDTFWTQHAARMLAKIEERR